jgi:hypothetical protein
MNCQKVRLVKGKRMLSMIKIEVSQSKSIKRTINSINKPVNKLNLFQIKFNLNYKSHNYFLIEYWDLRKLT